MRIGILTLPFNTNYGGIMQAYALQTVLERMGHKALVINQPNSHLWKDTLYKLPFKILNNSIQKYLLKKDVSIFTVKEHNRRIKYISQNTEKFIAQYIHSFNIKSIADIPNDKFDAIIVGSDQIWRPQYYTNIENAFLSFAKSWNIKRISYAASFGTNQWEYTPKQTQDCSLLVKKFNAVSVREKSGVDLCNKYLGIHAEHVLDPTMLLNKEDYIKLFIKANTPTSSGNLFYYFLDETPDKMELVKLIAEKNKLIPFKTNVQENKYEVQPPVEKWLRSFYDAKFIITDSFHACVFSIIFNKPFIAYGNPQRGMERFYSLLETFNLRQNLIMNKNDIKNFDINQYSADNSNIEEIKKTSYSFLKKTLKQS